MSTLEVVRVDISPLTENAEIIVNPLDQSQKMVVGDGIFDKLMVTLQYHLDVQYDNGRIKGEQYAIAFANTLQYALQASLTAWIQQPLVAQQIETEKAQKLLIEAQIALANAQKLLTDSQKLLTDQQTLTEKERTDLIASQAEVEQSKKDLYARQTQGYDDHLYTTIIKTQHDLYGIMFATGWQDPNALYPNDIIGYENMNNFFTLLQSRAEELSKQHPPNIPTP